MIKSYFSKDQVLFFILTVGIPNPLQISIFFSVLYWRFLTRRYKVFFQVVSVQSARLRNGERLSCFILERHRLHRQSVLTLTQTPTLDTFEGDTLVTLDDTSVSVSVTSQCPVFVLSWDSSCHWRKTGTVCVVVIYIYIYIYICIYGMNMYMYSDIHVNIWLFHMNECKYMIVSHPFLWSHSRSLGAWNP